MSKRIRNILSLAVAFCMVFSLTVVNVSAAPSVARTVTINLSANTGEPNDEITVELSIDSTANLSSLGYYLQLDPDVFEFDATVVSAGPGKTRLQCADAGWYSAAASGSIFLWAYLGAPQFGANPEAGTISVGGFAGVGVDPEYNEADALIGKFHLKIKDDALAGTSEITLFDARTLDYGADGGLQAEMIFTPVTFTVGGGVVTHTVTYDLNGGSGTAPAQQTVEEGTDFTVASAEGIIAPASKQFKEWNTASDGSGTVYAPGAEVTMGTSDIILYAIWEDIPVTTFTLTIGDTTNGSITLDPTGGVYDEDTVVTVTAIPNAGYQFVQFTGDSDSTENPITVTMTSDMTIGAIFEFIKGNQEAPAGLVGVAPTSEANDDGKITGTTAAMEYKLSTDTDYIACSDGETTGLVPGTYNVRYAETDTLNASPAATVIVPAYEAPITDPVIKIVAPSEPIEQGADAVVQVTVQNIPNGSQGVSFGISYDKDLLDVTVNDIQGSDNVDYSASDVTVGVGTLGFAATFDPSVVSFEDPVLVATITFSVKEDAVTGDTPLTFISGKYDDIDFAVKTPANINIIEAEDPELIAAENAVEDYEEAPLANLGDVAAAEAKGVIARDLVEALEDSAAKDALLDRLDAQDAKVAKAKAYFEAEAAVEAFEDAVEAVDSLDDIEEAELLGTAAANKVSALSEDSQDEIDAKTALQNRISAANTALGNIEARLTAEKAAQDAVAAYEEGAASEMTTLDEVAQAEAKEADAVAAVAALTYPESAALKTSLEQRIADRKVALAQRKEEIAVSNIDAGGEFTFDNLEALDIGADEENLELYQRAVDLVKEFLPSYDVLDKAKIADVVTAANSFDPDKKGDVLDEGQIGIRGAAWVRDLFLDRAADITIDKILRSDMDDDGTITVIDITDILFIIAKDAQS